MNTAPALFRRSRVDPGPLFSVLSAVVLSSVSR